MSRHPTSPRGAVSARLAAAAAILLPTPPAAVVAAAPSCRIEVRAVDAEGRPVRGASVRLLAFDSGGVPLPALHAAAPCNERGIARFLLAHAPEQVLFVVRTDPSPGGPAVSGARSVRGPFVGDPVLVDDLLALPDVGLEVSVRGADGAPIKNAEVALAPRHAPGDSGLLLRRDGDARGHLRIDGLLAAPYRVLVWAPGRLARLLDPVDLADPSSRRLPVELDEAPDIPVVRLRDAADGGPVRGWIRLRVGAGGGFVLGPYRSDEEGRVRLPFAPPDAPVLLQAGRDDGGRLPWTPWNPADGAVTLRLRAARRVEVRLQAGREAGSAEIARLEVEALAREGTGWTTALLAFRSDDPDVVVDAADRWRVPLPVTGRLRVAATLADGRRTERVTLAPLLDADPVASLPVAATPPAPARVEDRSAAASLVGELQAGRPAGRLVDLYRPHREPHAPVTWRRARRARVDATGRFAFPHVEPGPAAIAVAPPPDPRLGAFPASRSREATGGPPGRRVRLPEAGVLRVEPLGEPPRPVVVRGAVAVDGRPREGARVALWDTRRGTPLASSATGPLGRFLLVAETPPESFEVRLVEGALRASVRPEPTPEDPASFTAALAVSTGAVAGRVVPALTPAVPLRVALERRGRDGFAPVAQAVPDIEGRFRFAEASAGRYRLRVEDPSGRLATVVTPSFEVTAGAQRNTGPIELPRAVTLRVHLEAPQGRRPPFARLEVRPLLDPPRPDVREGWFVNGEAEVGLLPPVPLAVRLVVFGDWEGPEAPVRLDPPRESSLLEVRLRVRPRRPDDG